jgi:ATP-dependent DNA ligase
LVGPRPIHRGSGARRLYGKRLRDLGWVEGRNIAIEYHWAIIDGEQVRAETAELGWLPGYRAQGWRPRAALQPGNDMTRRFPLIAEALARLRSRSCIIDGGSRRVR